MYAGDLGGRSLGPSFGAQATRMAPRLSGSTALDARLNSPVPPRHVAVWPEGHYVAAALGSPAAIVAFAKNWNEDPTSNHHVLRELACSRRVVWLNSVATRTPKLSSGRDLTTIVRKLADFAKGPINVERDLWVFTPIVLPLPHSPSARRVNRQILKATLRLLRLRLGLSEFHLWTFLPNVADYVGSFGESLTVYYCVDEWSMFSYIDRQQMEASERRLLERADQNLSVELLLLHDHLASLHQLQQGQKGHHDLRARSGFLQYAGEAEPPLLGQ